MKKIKLGFLTGVFALQGFAQALQENKNTESIFTTRSIAAKIIVDVVSSPKPSELAALLVKELKSKVDKDQYTKLITQVRTVKKKDYKFSNFGDQIRLEDANGNILLVAELGEKDHTVLINGIVTISFDPANLWKSITTSTKDKKFSILSTFISEVNASPDEKKSTDIITSTILLTALGSNVNKEIRNSYLTTFAKEKSSWWQSLFQENTTNSPILRAVCIKDDKAKSTIQEWNNTTVEDMGEFYKVSSPKKNIYFKIKPAKSEMPASELSECYQSALLELYDYHINKVKNKNSVGSREGLDEIEIEIEERLERLERFKGSEREREREREIEERLKRQRLEILKRQNTFFYYFYNGQEVSERERKIPASCKALKIEFEKCDESRCVPSDFSKFAKEFDPSYKESKAVIYKPNYNRSDIVALKGKIAKLQEILADPNKYTGEETSNARKKIKEYEKEIAIKYSEEDSKRSASVELTRLAARSAARSSDRLMTEILNLNAFGKCCANSMCKADVFESNGLNMIYEKPTSKQSR